MYIIGQVRLGVPSTSNSSKNPCNNFEITPTFDNPTTSTQRMMTTCK